MKFKLIVTVALLLGLSAGNLLAETISPKTAKEILLKAQKLQATRTYSATRETGSGNKKISGKIFQFQHANSIIYYRKELISKYGKIISIKNEEGNFTIKSGQIKKNSYNRAKYAIPKFYDYAKYTVKEIKFNNIPCYLITKKLKKTNVLYELYREKLSNNNVKEKNFYTHDLFNKALTAVQKSYIGKKNMFIYKIITFDSLGKFKKNITYKNINLNYKPNMEVFKLPQHNQIITVGNFKEDIQESLKQNRLERKKGSSL